MGSPQEQGPYTSPAPPGSANFGDGTEAFYRYDTPEPGESAEEFGHAAALPGRLVAQRDLGTHTRYKYDALGRSTGVGRRVTLPGRPSSQLADRYTEHWYRQETAYDINDRIVSSSTGADVPELLAPGSSTVSMTYGPNALRGNPSSTTTSATSRAPGATPPMARSIGTLGPSFTARAPTVRANCAAPTERPHATTALETSSI